MTREKGHGGEERREKWKCSHGDAVVLKKGLEAKGAWLSVAAA